MSGKRERCIRLAVPARRFCGIMLVGEAPGAEEERTGVPFVGRAGKVLNRLLAAAGIKRDRLVITNVFHVRPPDNQVGFFFTRDPKRASSKWTEFEGQSLRKSYSRELRRLSREIRKYKPRVVVAVGRVALWALSGRSRIDGGSFITTCRQMGFPEITCLAVPHTAWLMRQPTIERAREEDKFIQRLRVAKRLAEVR